MKERIQSLLPEQKKEHEYHQDTVRVALLRMDPTRIASMLPSTEAIDHALETHPELQGDELTKHVLTTLSSVRPEISTMIWEVKADGKNVTNPNQVILPGGGGKPHDPNITAKTLIKAAIQEAAEEVHLVAHDPHVADVAYTYSIAHRRLPDTKKKGRLVNTSHLVVAQAAPHDQVRFFDPKDKLQGVLSLTPSEVTHLMENEFIRPDEEHFFPLVDSLAIQNPPPSTTTKSDPQEAHRFKAALENHTYVYEATTMRNVLQKLLRVPGANVRQKERHRIHKLIASAIPTDKREAQTQLHAITNILQNIEKSYADRTNDPIRGIAPDTFQTLVSRGANENDIKKRMKLMHDMSIAAMRTAEEISIAAYAKTGPQFPLLLSQLLSEKDTWNKETYELLSRSPVVKHIVDSVREACGIPTDSLDWYAKTVRTLQYIQRIRATDLEAYKAFGDALAQKYCNPLNSTGVHAIGSVEKLGRLSEEYEGFLKDITAPLDHLPNATSIFQLKPDPLGPTTQEIIELYLRMFNINQYDGETISHSERNAAMRKLCEMIRIDKVDELLEKKFNSEIFPLRKAVHTMLGKKKDTISIQKGVFDVYTIPKAKIAHLAQEIALPPSIIHNVDVSNFDQTILFGVRVKSRNSAYRKDLERGELDQENEDLSDIFGFMSALAADEFEKRLTKSHPHLPPAQRKDVTDIWKRWSSQLFLQSMIYTAEKERAAYHPHTRLSNGRASTLLKNILPLEEQHYGSASSDADWDWIKYVLNMNDNTGMPSQVEIQHFPTIGDMMKKKADDPQYERKRLFTSAPTRYPVMHVYFGMQESYDDVMKGYRTQGSTIQIQNERSIVDTLILKTHKKIQQIMNKRGIIYTATDD